MSLKSFFIIFITCFSFFFLVTWGYIIFISNLCIFSRSFFNFSRYSSVADLIALIWCIMILYEFFSYSFFSADTSILLKILDSSIYFPCSKTDLTSETTSCISNLLSKGKLSSELILNFHTFFITKISIIIFCFNKLFSFIKRFLIFCWHRYIFFLARNSG